MARDGSGNMVITDLTYSGTVCSQQKAAGVKIVATRMDNILTDIGTALTNSIAKNGETTVTANIPFAGYRVTNIGAATAGTDAARADQVQKGTLLYGGSAGGTADALTLTLTPAPSALTAGMVVSFFAGADNTGACTLNVNSLGATAIRAGRANTVALGARAIRSGEVVHVYYDGGFWRLLGGREGQKTYSPSYSPGGTMTWTETAITAIYEVINGRCSFMVKATGTVGGTPSDQLGISLPVTAAQANSSVACGYVDSSAVKHACVGFLTSTTVATVTKTGSVALTSGAGQIVYVSGDYHIA